MGPEGAGSPLVEGSVDSEEDKEEGEGFREVGGEGGEDYVTICDTRVRLRLCAAPPPRGRERSDVVPVKRKDLFTLLLG